MGYSLAYAVVHSGDSTLPHRLKSSEVYYILRGRGRMYIDAEKTELSPGDAVYIPPGSGQSIECISSDDLEFLCIVIRHGPPIAKRFSN